jgi:hypothetical protein
MMASLLQRIKRPSLLLGVVAIASSSLYVAWAYANGLVGFPLDDAWIHQTYARNVAQTGQLAYLPGQPSAGSTSPAWTFLLSVGYMLGVDYRLWTYLLGGLSLAAAAWLTYHILLRLVPTRTQAALLAGLLCAVEWHLVWAAVSGMETMFFTALSLALLEYSCGHTSERTSQEGPASLQKERIIVGAVGIGLLGGVLTLTRPEGLGLVALVLAGMLVLPHPPTRSEAGSRLLAVGIALVSLGIVVIPIILFNINSSGSMMPSTFYAKQAEYQSQVPLPVRFWRVLSPTLVGAQVLLVPGFCYAAYRVLRERHWLAGLPLAWWLGLLTVYALRLPVDYQHGRYTMPTIPLLILYGIWGTAEILRPHSSRLLVRVFSRALPAATVILALVFWARGAIAYADDVGFIEAEMVKTALWLNEHTSPDDLIAVHDIGAVGYVMERPLLDLAGLISPEIIPFMRDADQMLEWMTQREAAYVVFFPDFSPTYEALAADPRLQQVYCTDYAWTRSTGHKNMCVYRLSIGDQQ